MGEVLSEGSGLDPRAALLAALIPRRPHQAGGPSRRAAAASASVPGQQIGGPLADHDRRRVRVPARHSRDHRHVHDAQAVDAPHPQLRIDHGADRAGPDRVVEAVGDLAHVSAQVGVGVGRRRLVGIGPCRAIAGRPAISSRRRWAASMPPSRARRRASDVTIRGLAPGSAERSRTSPRPSGLSTHAPADHACSVGGINPSSANITGAMWNWMSGASRPSRVRQKPPASAMFDVSGPRPSVCSSATFASLSAVISVSVSVRMISPALTWSERFAPTAGLVEPDLDPVLAQVLGGPDPREHQQLRRVVGPGAHHDLALDADRLRDAVDQRLGADRAVALEQQPRTGAPGSSVRLGRLSAGWR